MSYRDRHFYLCAMRSYLADENTMWLGMGLATYASCSSRSRSVASELYSCLTQNFPLVVFVCSYVWPLCKSDDTLLFLMECPSEDSSGTCLSLLSYLFGCYPPHWASYFTFYSPSPAFFINPLNISASAIRFHRFNTSRHQPGSVYLHQALFLAEPISTLMTVHNLTAINASRSSHELDLCSLVG